MVLKSSVSTFVRNGSRGFYSRVNIAHNAFFQCKIINFEAEFLKNDTVNMLDTEWVNSQDGPEDNCINLCQKLWIKGILQ